MSFNFDNAACDCFIKDSFNQMLRNENYSDAAFSLFYPNIRSIQRSFNNFINLLSLLDVNFTLIRVSETLLNDSIYKILMRTILSIHIVPTRPFRMILQR